MICSKPPSQINSSKGTNRLIRYMQAWEEFATRVLGNTEHTYELINQAGQEAKNGAAIVFPMFVWVAKATS